MIDYFGELLPAAEQACSDAESLSDTLDLMALHQSLTPDNLLLLKMQMPNATALGGFKAWETGYHRSVKKDVVPIVLLKPQVGSVKDHGFEEDADGEVVVPESGKVTGTEYLANGISYTPVHLYDISQTTPSDETPNLEQPYLLTAEDINNGFRAITSCAVMVGEDKSGKLAIYNKEENSLTISTDDKPVIAKECIRALCMIDTSSKYSNGLYAKLVSECATEVVCRVNHVGTKDSIILLQLWKGEGKNPEEYLELLNQISRVSRNVLSQLRQATNHAVLFDFLEVCLLNQVMNSQDPDKAMQVLTELMQHTDVPVLYDAAKSLKVKIMLFASTGKIPKIYEDRMNHNVMTQPIYRI